MKLMPSMRSPSTVTYRSSQPSSGVAVTRMVLPAEARARLAETVPPLMSSSSSIS